MASFVFEDAFVTINAVDLSDRVVSLELTLDVEPQDASVMGTFQRINQPGLKVLAATVTFRADFAAGEVDATIGPLWANRTIFVVELRPDNAAASATNPEYTGSAFIASYTPMGGSVGETAGASITLSPTTEWTRETT